eukprot:8335727-Alexandrium_andersonii.AAC.1
MLLSTEVAPLQFDLVPGRYDEDLTQSVKLARNPFDQEPVFFLRYTTNRPFTSVAQVDLIRFTELARPENAVPEPTQDDPSPDRTGVAPIE